MKEIKDKFTIESLDMMLELWSKTYNNKGKPDWSHILPYYADDIHFRDTVQEIYGIEEFKNMVERLTRRSNELRMVIKNAVWHEDTIFMEWEMIINFKDTKTSSIYGSSKITLNEEGKIKDQRDYYDLWGDILDNIPLVNRVYRKFMKRVFG